MEQFDLLLRLKKQDEKNYSYDFFIGSDNQIIATGTIDNFFVITSPRDSVGVFGVKFRKSLDKQKQWDVAIRAVRDVTSDRPASFLIELVDEELYALPWEHLLEVPFFHKDFPNHRVIRYLSQPSIAATWPLILPIDTLIASSSMWSEMKDLPDENVLRYFRSTKLTGVTKDKFAQLTNHAEFDLVHITGRSDYDDLNKNLFYLGEDDVPVHSQEMQSLLKSCRAKFLILQITKGKYEDSIKFAHTLLHESGPTILLLNWMTGNPKKRGINELYFDIVHDHPLNFAFSLIPKEFQPILLMADGGSDVLRISPLENKLTRQFDQHLDYAKKVLSSLKRNMSLAGKKGFNVNSELYRTHYDKISDFISMNQSEFKKELDYRYESGAMEPLKKMEKINSTLKKYLKESSAVTRRVVNCWFTDEKDKICKRRLEKNSSCFFHLQIGAALKQSIIHDATPFPDKEISSFFKEEGILLTVRLFSSDFEIEEPVTELVLPKPPGESEEIRFKIHTPGKSAVARLRVGIYYKENLLQSIIVSAPVGAKKWQSAFGISAEVDFSLANSIDNPEVLSPRTLNIAVNESGNGTHSLYIAGGDLHQKLDFGEGVLNKSVKQSRDALLNICSTKDRDGNLKDYRFDKNNKGNETEFVTEIIKLAQFGYNLLHGIIVKSGNKEIKAQLKKLLAAPASRIQIASTKSANYVFPWALVYDKPLEYDDNIVCPEFLSDIKNKGLENLQNSNCIVNGCIHESDPKVVCPSGFWGYRHIIEQPISSAPDSGGSEEVIVDIPASQSSSVLMPVSLDLDNVEDHYKELLTLNKIKIQKIQDKREVKQYLPKQDFQVIYFYCHGGRNETDTWLGIGSRQKIYPPELDTWEVKWQEGHPFVFINGCHTVDVTPDDFVVFNQTFGCCEAAGVMGTEISIVESLARHFANGFFKRFLNGINVGVAVREQRLEMLKNYNLLGLAFTPYCYADLKIKYS